jgi:hypothetical protein
LPNAQVRAALKDQGVLERFVQVTPIAAAQFFRHVKLSGGEHQAWRNSVVQSLGNSGWAQKADPAEMQRLWEIGIVEPLPEAKKARWQQSMRMRDASMLKRAGVQIESSRQCVEAWVNQSPSSEELFFCSTKKR